MTTAAVTAARDDRARQPLGAEAANKKDEAKHPRDPAREVIETIVFVVVLVLLLKLFVTEAFVIPTGSMAETLYGYQKIVSCAKCGHEFPVNSHDEVEPNPLTGQKRPLVGYCCPNCRYQGDLRDLPKPPESRTGDRVLVLKPLYHFRPPERGDVVVFKFPKKPQENHVAANYIKRAMGFGGETLAVHRGELYVTTSLSYPADNPLYPRPDSPLDLWEERYMYPNSGQAEQLFEASRLAQFTDRVPGGFRIVRKTEEQLLADRRVVWDNDKQPTDPAGFAPRWQPVGNAAAWRGDSATQPRAFAHTGPGTDWLRYQHLVWKLDGTGHRIPWRWPQDRERPVAGPIDNMLGYNAGTDWNPAEQRADARRDAGPAPTMWVGDLIVECEAELAAGAELVLELSKGAHRYQARFGNGQVALARVDANRNPDPAFAPAPRPCKVTAGTYKLRFANVDNKLWVWVDGRPIDFGTDAEYTAVEPATYDPADTAKEGWTRANDVDAPAGIGARGEVPAVRGIRLYRDIYYTNNRSAHTEADVYYVHPGHYLCLGDNSAQSSDSRTWGTVPERLMLGKAVFVFWPAYPAPNRVGFIK